VLLIVRESCFHTQAYVVDRFLQADYLFSDCVAACNIMGRDSGAGHRQSWASFDRAGRDLWTGRAHSLHELSHHYVLKGASSNIPHLSLIACDAVAGCCRSCQVFARCC
jgi:hypothetical protein